MKQRLQLDLPRGYQYLGGEDYVLDRGNAYESAPLDESEQALLATAIARCSIRQFPLRYCYHNAQLLTAADPTGILRYCEGWALGFAGIPTLHGWVSVHGKVIDLTWRIPKRRPGRLGDRVMGVIPHGWGYYGVAFDGDTVVSRLIRLRATGSFLDDVADGFPLFQEPRLRSVQEVLNGSSF